MDARELVRQIGQREPLNPYQIAGLVSVIERSGVHLSDGITLEVERLKQVLMVLDRTGEPAAPYLVDLRQSDSRMVIFPRFTREDLQEIGFITGFRGRRAALLENLVPILYEIPNWLDLVRTLSRYILDRDDKALAGRLPVVMEIILAFLFASARQPFDAEARSEGEYVLSRLVESILKSASDEMLPEYVPFAERALAFLLDELFPIPVNPFERRVLEAYGIRSAMDKRSEEIQRKLRPSLDKMAAQAVVTALGEIEPTPAALGDNLVRIVEEHDFPEKPRFETEVVARINLQSGDEIAKRRELFRSIRDGSVPAEPSAIRGGIDFIRGVADEWGRILASFQELVSVLPRPVQAAFGEILAAQILAIEKPEIKDLLINGLCEIVLSLEKTRKRASSELVDSFARQFLDRAHATHDTGEVIACLTAVERLGVTLGRAGYSLTAEQLIGRLTQGCLIAPREKHYTLEDDDTGEPLVLAEETEANQSHVKHIKTLLAIIASNPRIMHRLVPYLTVQIELGGAGICDEDLIQYWISCLLRANSPVTHFLVRTLIKALPYSFKDIGPLDNLRLTAAGLARELANRGIRPIGNFLGKLRGDIHWRGSIENYYFCLGILKYLATGNREEISDWMPPESMPHLGLGQWCSPEEADGVKDLCGRILIDYGISLSDKDDMESLIHVDTTAYRDNDTWPEFSRRVVLDVLELVKGLHAKYFVVQQRPSGEAAIDDLDRLAEAIAQRRTIKEQYLTNDNPEAMPHPVTLTEGTGDHVRQMEQIWEQDPDTPIVLRAKKAGHAYAQKATYKEKRFEAFTQDLGLEALQETLATSISNTRFHEITLESLPDALRFVDLLTEGLAVNGHSSVYLEQSGNDLRDAGMLGLTLDKVRDLLKIIKKELDDIHIAYRAWYEEHLDVSLGLCRMEQLPRKLSNLTTLKSIPDTDFHRNYLKTLYISDLQARDGNLRVLETFVEKVELFLNRRLAESGRKVVPAGESQRERIPIYFPEMGEISPCRIGLKAALLRFAANTPPYFVITTDQELKDRAQMETDSEFRNRVKDAVQKLERQIHRSFGDPADPLLLSVRSGARVSMPGMMITITNVGINDEIAAGLAERVNAWFAYDCYRRFLQEFGQSVYGVDREEFQDIIDERKRRSGVDFKAQFSSDQMKRLSFDYKDRLGEFAPEAVDLLDRGEFLDILIQCAACVLHSYDIPAARKYRQAAGIDGEWRTPATVQAMVYGNLEYDTSGTGVISYDPFAMELRGDFAHGDQGTDVVGGKVTTMPVYDLWKQQKCLATQLPECWKQLYWTLRDAAERVHFHANLEYTIEKGRVYILQIRKNRERKERLPSLESSGYHVIAQGTGVSGKIFRGIMVTHRDQIAPYRHINRAQSIIDAMNEALIGTEKLDGFIFVVNDPIPEEIMDEVFSLPVAAALVSRLGGRGAHAADIAKSLGKVYVGQVRQMAKFAGRPEFVRFGTREVVVGSKMIVHGQTGEIALY